jgi:RNA polymerase sigma-70 factor (ECF subfamily)
MLKLQSDPVRQRSNVEIVAWLRRVSINLAINRRRDVERWRRRAERGDAGRSADPEDPASAAVRSDERARVRVVLSTLSMSHQSILHLRYSGLSYAEIAAAMNISISSVGTTLARAERAFRAAYPMEES